MTGVTWQMDLVPAWIIQQCENSTFDPSPITTSPYGITAAVKDTNTFNTASPSDFGAYGSGKHWSLVTNNGQIVEVASVSGSTVTLKQKLRSSPTWVKAREINVLNIDRIAKLYLTGVTEEFDAQINPEKEQKSPSNIGLPMLIWTKAKIWSIDRSYQPIFEGGITINGTTLTQGVDFDLTTASGGDEAIVLIVSAINSGIPDVTATQLSGSHEKIVLTGVVRSVSTDLLEGAGTIGYSIPVLTSNIAGFPQVYLDNDLKVTRTLKLKGYLLTDNRRSALKYRNALWNLSRVGWVRVLQADYDWEWYILNQVNLSKIATSAVNYPRYPAHKFVVYNYVRGAAGTYTLTVNGTTFVAGTGFASTVSNDNTAANIAAVITLLVPGVTATASGNEVLLYGTVTEISSGDDDSWTAIVGGKQLGYQYALDITLTHAPPTSQKDTTEAQ